VVRLQKFLAEAGIASRRASEQVIIAGRVTVNGAVASQLGAKVDPQQDRVAVDGRVVARKRKLYIAVNKPPGFICTRGTEDERRRIGDLLPREWTELFSVGRLDYQSEGLIFLTNDGDFCLKLTHPRYGIPRKYVACVEGRVTAEMIKNFTQGVVSAGETLKARRARLVSANNSNSIVELELTERVQIGPIKLGQLPAGKWRVLTEPEIKSLLPVL